MKLLPALYIHVPFCRKKCAFCSFAVAVSQMSHRASYVAALDCEAKCYAGNEVSSIYIGGGTPSCLEVEDIRMLFETIDRYFKVAVETEKTFEANPESLDAGKADVLVACGVNRVSLGVQSMDDQVLSFLGRAHRREEAMKAFRLLRKVGFRNVNVDVVFGVPGQTVEALRDDLGRIIDLGCEHISIYSLTVDERSLFFARKIAVDSDLQAKAYGLVCRELTAAGFLQYEVSNFARRGYESRHNLNYWLGGEYIGLGMAAHSHLDGRRFWNADTLPAYLKMMTATGAACVGEEKLLPLDKLIETFLFGLRMNEGVDLGGLEGRLGAVLSQDRLEQIEYFIEEGLLEEAGRFIRATERGRLVLDEISARLV